MSSTTSTGDVALENGMHYALSLRSERPIVGCELAPHPFMFLKGGTLDNATRAKLMEANPHKFTFRWYRGPRRQLCQNDQCPRGNTYEPIYWSKAAIGGASLRCAVCEKADAHGHQSFFCSANCFKFAWKKHCAGKHNFVKNAGNISGKSRRLSNLDDELLTDPDAQDEEGKMANAILSDTDGQWVSCGADKIYIPTQDDVGCVLKIEVCAVAVNDERKIMAGPIVTFTEPVLAAPRPPPKRPLVTVPSPAPAGATGARFRVISYNILAELYATKQAYPYCDAWSLSWPYRRAMIEQELEDAQGDIVCLQEVQADHYEQHINPFMQKLGYDGMFKQKSRESMGQYGKVDGCATFWRRSKFIMLENYSIEFNDCARDAAAALGLDDQECRRYMNRLSRDNIAQVFVLEALTRTAAGANVRQPRQMTNVCVVNTHLYSNHARPDVKLWQTMTLMREVEQIALSRDIAVMVCGDFNSEPDSAVHEYMATGALELQHPELIQSDTLGILPDHQDIVHGVEFASIMESALGTEPPYTNFTGNFKGTLDYIWYTPGRLRVLAVTNVPDPNDLFEQCGEGLPAANYPSDHVMLCADVAFAVSGAGTVTRPQTHRRHLLTGAGAAAAVIANKAKYSAGNRANNSGRG